MAIVQQLRMCIGHIYIYIYTLGSACWKVRDDQDKASALARRSELVIVCPILFCVVDFT